jgi:hypothetical protein
MNFYRHPEKEAQRSCCSGSLKPVDQETLKRVQGDKEGA